MYIRLDDLTALINRQLCFLNNHKNHVIIINQSSIANGIPIESITIYTLTYPRRYVSEDAALYAHTSALTFIQYSTCPRWVDLIGFCLS